LLKILENKWIYYILLTVCAVAFFISFSQIYLWYSDNNRTKDLMKSISVPVIAIQDSPDGKVYSSEEVDSNAPYNSNGVEYIKTNFDDLLKRNQDTVGWVAMIGTTVNYPILQSKDNDYYLTHSFDKSSNAAGWIFADFRNDMSTLDRNTIIYGHNRIDNSMFGSVAFALHDWWYKDPENYIIKLNTLYDQTIWQIFSIYVIPEGNDYIQTYFSNDKEYIDFISKMQGRSQKVFNITLTAQDKILTLSTCQGSKNRLVVHAKLIRATHNRIPN